MILAEYTIRSKQDYIFKTNRIVEIVGASKLISGIWDDLFKIASDDGYTVVRNDSDVFCYEKIKESIESTDSSACLDKLEWKKAIVELFQGGGNLTVLYDSKCSYISLNKLFSYYVLKEYPGMIPMATYVDVSGDYIRDYQDLKKASEIEKNRMNPGRDKFILPFSKMDRDTFMPIAGEKLVDGPKEDISYESAVKRKRGVELREKNKDIKFLDDMITKKGTESLLSVVHADGNNMGRKITNLLGKDTDYSNCVSKMRKFTRITKEVFIDNGLSAMDKCRKELESRYPKLDKMTFAFRPVIADGDDFTFICNARFVMEYTRAYLKAIEEYQIKDEGLEAMKYSSCAGICIFHSHYPFAKAYSIAEQACDDYAKEKVHGVSDKVVEEGWIDFHFIHSGVGGNLSVIRDEQGTEEVMARPWLVTGDGKNGQSYQKLTEVQKILKSFGVPRSAVKDIGASWESSRTAGSQALIRVCGKKPGLKEKLKNVISDDKDLLKTIYDLSEVYDIWFEEIKHETKN